MLKIPQPFWNRALIGRSGAPLKKGYWISLIPTNGIDRAMPSDSTKLLVDLREKVSFHVGRVKNPQFLFPAKKAVDVRWEVVHPPQPKNVERDIYGYVDRINKDSIFTTNLL